MYKFQPAKPDKDLSEIGVHFKAYRFDYQAIEKQLMFYLSTDQDDEYYTLLRIIVQEDFFAFCWFILELPVNDPFLIQRCYDAQDKRHLTIDLWAREHFKSTILTYALPIWELIQNREERIGIFSHKRSIAKKFLRRIKEQLETNTLFHVLFPDIFYANPKKEAPRWGDEGLYVKRHKTYNEASIEAWGIVEDAPTGLHFSIMIYDDLVTRDSVTNAEMINKTTEAFKESFNLGTRHGTKRVIGTRYSHKDTYSELIKQGKWTVRTYPAEVDETGKAKRCGRPVFLTAQELDEKFSLQGEYVYNAQMLQNPTADSLQGFKKLWLKYWEIKKPENVNYYITVDPASSRKTGSDYTVMSVIATDHNRAFFLIDMVRDKLSLGEKWEKLRDLYLKYSPMTVGYERYGMDSDIQYINMQQEEEGIYFTIEELGGNQSSKIDRIKKLVPLFQGSRFILPRALIYTDVFGSTRNLIEEFIDEEFELFPYAKHDDMLDSLARIMDAKMMVTFPVEKKPEEKESLIDFSSPWTDSPKENDPTGWMTV